MADNEDFQPDAALPPPTRAEIEQRWLGIITGAMTREEVNNWAEHHMLGGPGSADVMVMSALQHLDGFDMTVNSAEPPLGLKHGPPGAYYRSISDITEELTTWRTHCIEYDADPQGWVAQKRAEARARWQANLDALAHALELRLRAELPLRGDALLERAVTLADEIGRERHLPLPRAYRAKVAQAVAKKVADTP